MPYVELSIYVCCFELKEKGGFSSQSDQGLVKGKPITLLLRTKL
jgi:hypothetical protein